MTSCTLPTLYPAERVCTSGVSFQKPFFNYLVDVCECTFFVYLSSKRLNQTNRRKKRSVKNTRSKFVCSVNKCWLISDSVPRPQLNSQFGCQQFKVVSVRVCLHFLHACVLSRCAHSCDWLHAALTRAPAGQAEPEWRDWEKKGEMLIFIYKHMTLVFFVSFLCSPVL